MEICGAHNLTLDYESKCKNLHGHNWIITVYCKSKELDKNGMVMDFKHIKNMISDKLDHQYINNIVDFNPTAENIAKWICDQIGEKCYKVSVQESEGNIAIYEREE
jgi:6-pyruvoyltetrahydropterin/6-carboxytetrahydropterin synthase